MTPEQVRLARHALGLDRCRVAYRNSYQARPGSKALAEWQAMVAAGLAKQVARGSSQYVLFRITNATAQAVLQPGERLR